MATFSGPLTATYYPKEDGWFIHEPFWFIRDNKEKWYVPAGWVSDLASTDVLPGVLEEIFPSDGPYNQAAVLHDYLYAAELINRSMADQIFKEALKAIPEVPRWKIEPMFWAVRMFGGYKYKEQHPLARIAFLRTLIGITNLMRPLWKDNKPQFK